MYVRSRLEGIITLMKTLVENFSNQLKEAITIGEKAIFTSHNVPVQNIIISGMGGSGIGGTIVSEVVKDSVLIPIEVVKGYFLPAYVNENTLVIVSSYSGNTEETLKCLEQALQKSAKIICITSGGQVVQIAQEKNIDLVVVPGNMPPRAALGYSLVALFYILHKAGILNDSFKQDLNQSIELLQNEKDNIKIEAQNLANLISNKMPIIYAPAGQEGITIRWRQQLNENSKMLGWYGTVPEMNHNELMGWSQNKENLIAIFLRDEFEYDRIARRIDFSKKFIEGRGSVAEIFVKGQTKIEKMFYLIHLGDWVSVYLSEMRKVDPNDIAVIEELKKVLAS